MFFSIWKKNNNTWVPNLKCFPAHREFSRSTLWPVRHVNKWKGEESIEKISSIFFKTDIDFIISWSAEIGN